MSDQDDPEFRKLAVPYVLRRGTEVYAFDKTKARFEDLEQINRPLVIGEQIVTTGLCGDIRIGEVVQTNLEDDESEETAVVDDGPCWLFLHREHDGWRCHLMALKEVMEKFT